MPDYDWLVNAYGRRWLSEHQSGVGTGQDLSNIQVDPARRIALRFEFQDEYDWSEETHDPARFTIGLEVPVIGRAYDENWDSYVGPLRHWKSDDPERKLWVTVWIQNEAENIDIPELIKGILYADQYWSSV